MTKDTKEKLNKTNNKYEDLTVEQANLINRSFPLHSEYFDAMKFLVKNYTFLPSEYKQIIDTQQLAYKRTAMFIKYLSEKEKITKETFLKTAYEVAEKASGTKNLPSIYFSLTYFYNNIIPKDIACEAISYLSNKEKAGDINKDVRNFICALTLKYKLIQSEKYKLNYGNGIDYGGSIRLTEYESLAIENGLEELIEKSEAEKIIEENYFFQKDERVSVKVYRYGLVRKIAFLMNYMLENDCIDNTGLARGLGKIFNTDSVNYHEASINRDLLYFYNEAIPVEYKDHIASYKFRFKKETSITDSVRKKILLLTEKYQEKQAGVQKRK